MENKNYIVDGNWWLAVEPLDPPSRWATVYLYKNDPTRRFIKQWNSAGDRYLEELCVHDWPNTECKLCSE